MIVSKLDNTVVGFQNEYIQIENEQCKSYISASYKNGLYGFSIKTILHRKYGNNFYERLQQMEVE